METLPIVHFVPQEILNPQNPLSVILIGAGGTGSRMLGYLIDIHNTLIALEHPGLHVKLYDDDRVSIANLNRQKFVEAELGLYKSVALINRINRAYGTNWKAHACKYECDTEGYFPPDCYANIYISCVDTAMARFRIADILTALGRRKSETRDKAFYWLDCGNSRVTGQMLLSTLRSITQPESKKFAVRTELPLVTDEFRGLLSQVNDSEEPSCSQAEALRKQDLFINPGIATMSASLLWNLFTSPYLECRGFFLNMKELHATPIGIG